MGNCCTGRGTAGKEDLPAFSRTATLPRRSNPLPETSGRAFLVNGKKMPLDLRLNPLWNKRMLAVPEISTKNTLSLYT